MTKYKDLKELLKHVWGVEQEESDVPSAGLEPPPTDNQSTFLEPLPTNLERFNPSLKELSTMLGPEWQSVSETPYLLAGYVHLIRESRMIAAGVVPPWFRELGYCENCGQVPLNLAAQHLAGCPWCHTREKPQLLS